MNEEIKNLLIPYVFPDLKRYGGNFDGGYIFSERLLSETKHVYSYGIGGNEESITFDRDMAAKGKNVFLYDGSIDKFWGDEKKFFFQKENVNSNNIHTHIKNNNHLNETKMILKMDIESNEYETLLNCNENLFNYFNQIGIEIHSILTDCKEKAINLFKRINKFYNLVHIHGNNHDLIIQDGICNTLELTYIRKDCFSDNLEVLPFACPRQELDFPNYPFRDDVKMNWWLQK